VGSQFYSIAKALKSLREPPDEKTLTFAIMASQNASSFQDQAAKILHLLT